MSSRGRRPGRDNVRAIHDIPGKHDSNIKRRLEHHPAAQKVQAAGIESFPTPKWMTDEEKELFGELRDTIVASGTATVTDAISLQMLTTQYSEYQMIHRIICEEGHVQSHENRDGVVNTKAHPLLSERARCFSNTRSLLTEFGMTPSSRRTVLKAEPDKADSPAEDEWDDILGDGTNN